MELNELASVQQYTSDHDCVVPVQVISIHSLHIYVVQKTTRIM